MKFEDLKSDQKIILVDNSEWYNALKKNGTYLVKGMGGYFSIREIDGKNTPYSINSSEELLACWKPFPKTLKDLLQ